MLVEFVELERASGFHETDDTGEITSTTSLLLEGVVELHGLGDGLAVRNLRLTGDGVDVVFTTHALDVDVEMELSHTGDNGLLGFGVNVHTEGGILALEAVHGFREVGGIFVVLGLDGEGDDGFGDEHGSLFASSVLTITRNEGVGTNHGVGKTTIGKGITR